MSFYGFLSKFPCLQRLIITSGNTLAKEQHDDLDNAVLQVFGANSNLKLLDISWGNLRVFKRWVEGVPHSQPIELSENWLMY